MLSGRAATTDSSVGRIVVGRSHEASAARLKYFYSRMRENEGCARNR